MIPFFMRSESIEGFVFRPVELKLGMIGFTIHDALYPIRPNPAPIGALRRLQLGRVLKTAFSNSMSTDVLPPCRGFLVKTIPVLSL